MDLQLVRRRFAEAERHVALGEKHLVRQAEIVDEFERNGHPTDLIHTRFASLERRLSDFQPDFVFLRAAPGKLEEEDGFPGVS